MATSKVYTCDRCGVRKETEDDMYEIPDAWGEVYVCVRRSREMDFKERLATVYFTHEQRINTRLYERRLQKLLCTKCTEYVEGEIEVRKDA